MSKYYTPRLEEFRIGFEYEIIDMCSINGGPRQNQWVKRTFNSLGDSQLHWRISSYPEELRVKYLDRSDIESCGFEWLREVTSHTFQMNNNEIRLKYYDDSNELFISHESRRKLFDGVVKNLNEFKMILEMIGVEYER